MHHGLWGHQSGIKRSLKKITAHCLCLPPIFGPRLSDGVVKIFPLPTPVAMATNFGTIKIDYNSAPVKIVLCLHLPSLYPEARLYSVKGKGRDR